MAKFHAWGLLLPLSLAACSGADADATPTDAASGDTDTQPEQSFAPVISPASGAVAYGTEVKLFAYETNTELRYTVDNTPATPSSLLYGEPILVNPAGATMTVRAIAISPHKTPSKEVSATYTVTGGMIVHFKKPPSWASAHLHYWNSVPDNQGSTWPGPAMVDEGNGWYVASLAGQTASHLIFNAGGAPQTADLYWAQPEGWFDDGDFWNVAPERMACCAYPGGKYKALVMSFDDGNQQDKPLIQIFNAHGIKGSFHLNSGLMANADKVHADEAVAVYAGHEVSVHSRTHPNVETMNQAQLEDEILGDKTALEALFGYPMRGLSYPFGSYNQVLLDLLPGWGLRYGRVVPSTNDFRLPGDFLLWRGSAHHSAAWDLAQNFVVRSTAEMGVLFIWGHSWELDGNQPNNSWDYMESLCGVLGNRDDTWYVSAADLTDYLLAVRALQFSADGLRVFNPSTLAVFVKKGGVAVELGAGQSLDL